MHLTSCQPIDRIRQNDLIVTFYQHIRLQTCVHDSRIPWTLGRIMATVYDKQSTTWFWNMDSPSSVPVATSTIDNQVSVYNTIHIHTCLFYHLRYLQAIQNRTWPSSRLQWKTELTQRVPSCAAIVIVPVTCVERCHSQLWTTGRRVSRHGCLGQAILLLHLMLGCV